MQDINALLEALKISPENIPLRIHIAGLYIQSDTYDEAIHHLKEALKHSPEHSEASVLLGQCYYLTDNYSASIILLENHIDGQNPKALQYYCLSLFKEGNSDLAEKYYKQLINAHPDFADEELDNAFRSKNSSSEEHDFIDDTPFVEQCDLSFKDVGGMDGVKKQIDLKILKPLQHPDLYKAYGKKSGGGILMYGPPGCGKTYIAKATAGEMNARFINISLNEVLSQWQGESERLLNELFNSARRNTPCVLFIDEIDAIAAKRSDLRNSAGKTLVNQLLSELDGFEKNNEGVLVIGATNVPWHLDPAILRPGRFDRLIFIPPPDMQSRESIFNIHLKDKPLGKINYQKLAKHSKNYSGADISACIDVCIEMKLEESFEKNGTVNIETSDLASAMKKHQPVAVNEWLKTARNYAVYSNESGLYNEILEYINKK